MCNQKNCNMFVKSIIEDQVSGFVIENEVEGFIVEDETSGFII